MTPEEIAARRAALGLSQSQLGEILSVKQNTVSSWERGNSTPSAGVIVAIGALEDAALARQDDISNTLHEIDDPLELLLWRGGVVDGLPAPIHNQCVALAAREWEVDQGQHVTLRWAD